MSSTEASYWNHGYYSRHPSNIGESVDNMYSYIQGYNQTNVNPGSSVLCPITRNMTGYESPSIQHNTGMVNDNLMYRNSHCHSTKSEFQTVNHAKMYNGNNNNNESLPVQNDVLFAARAIRDVSMDKDQLGLHQTSNPSSSKSDKPPYSYIALICMALDNSPTKKCTLGEIVGYIKSRFSYYSESNKLKGSIRHNLTLNDCFVKSGRRLGDKGCMWTLDSTYGDMFKHGSLLRRKYRLKEGRVDKYRRNQKSKKSLKQNEDKNKTKKLMSKTDIVTLSMDITDSNSTGVSNECIINSNQITPCTTSTPKPYLKETGSISKDTQSPIYSPDALSVHSESYARIRNCSISSDESYPPCSSSDGSHSTGSSTESSFPMFESPVSVDWQSVNAMPQDHVYIPSIMNSYIESPVSYNEQLCGSNSLFTYNHPASLDIPEIQRNLHNDFAQVGFDTRYNDL